MGNGSSNGRRVQFNNEYIYEEQLSPYERQQLQLQQQQQQQKRKSVDRSYNEQDSFDLGEPSARSRESTFSLGQRIKNRADQNDTGEMRNHNNHRTYVRPKTPRTDRRVEKPEMSEVLWTSGHDYDEDDEPLTSHQPLQQAPHPVQHVENHLDPESRDDRRSPEWQEQFVDDRRPKSRSSDRLELNHADDGRTLRASNGVTVLDGEVLQPVTNNRHQPPQNVTRYRSYPVDDEPAEPRMKYAGQHRAGSIASTTSSVYSGGRTTSDPGHYSYNVDTPQRVRRVYRDRYGRRIVQHVRATRRDPDVIYEYPDDDYVTDGALYRRQVAPTTSTRHSSPAIIRRYATKPPRYVSSSRYD